MKSSLQTDYSEFCGLEEPAGSIAGSKDLRGTVVESAEPRGFTGDLDEDVEALDALEVRLFYCGMESTRRMLW